MKPRVFRFGIDTIRFNFDAKFQSPIFESFFSGLSDNSNQKFGVFFLNQEFSASWTMKNTQKECMEFAYAGDNVFALDRILDGGIVQSISYVLTVHGAAFYIESLDHFLTDLLERYMPHLTLSRLDLCLDTDIPVHLFYKRRRTQFKKERCYWNRGILESFYLGKDKNNKKHFIRVYDKKLDSREKGKFHLFFAYLQEKIVTRIEVELHTKTINDMEIIPSTILEYERERLAGFPNGKNTLHKVFASLCINESGTNFTDLKKTDIAKAERIRTAVYTGSVEDMNTIEKVPYIKDFLGRARRIREMGIDPIELIRMRL